MLGTDMMARTVLSFKIVPEEVRPLLRFEMNDTLSPMLSDADLLIAANVRLCFARYTT